MRRGERRWTISVTDESATLYTGIGILLKRRIQVSPQSVSRRLRVFRNAATCCTDQTPQFGWWHTCLMIGRSRVQTLAITLIVVLPSKRSDRDWGPPSLLFPVSKLGTSGETTLLPLYVFMACTRETCTLPKSLRGSTGLVDQGCTNPGPYIAYRQGD